MNIGFVSTWFERGAAYVTKQYAQLLEAAGHNIFIFARGESFAKGDPAWDLPYVTWGKKLYDTSVDFNQFGKWIENNQLDCVFFNEQRDMRCVLKTKQKYPNVKIGTYVDYYTQGTVDSFKFYDFLICNTKRHYSVFCDHPQCYYIPWGTDTNKYAYMPDAKPDQDLCFFHSAGMSNRKGTDVLVKTFIDHKLYEQSKLIVHTQMPIEQLVGQKAEALEKYNIEVVEKTVTAPGLYYRGDVYVYPTTLDGLGLTMYEAFSSGLPVIATDCAPMNEVVNDEVGRVVAVDKYICRWDAYYWPLAFVNEDSLADAMKYYIDRKDRIVSLREKAREYAVANYEWADRQDDVNRAFLEARVVDRDPAVLEAELRAIKKTAIKALGKTMISFMPKWMQEFYFRNR